MSNSLHYVYILRCSDGSLYAGLTSDLETRLAQHQQGLDRSAYTFGRRPVDLVWSEGFSDRNDAFAVERQIKGWSRAKKIVLIGGGVETVHVVARLERQRRKGVRGGSK